MDIIRSMVNKKASTIKLLSAGLFPTGVKATALLTANKVINRNLLAWPKIASL
jgi:hypothetical protein